MRDEGERERGERGSTMKLGECLRGELPMRDEGEREMGSTMKLGECLRGELPMRDEGEREMGSTMKLGECLRELPMRDEGEREMGSTMKLGECLRGELPMRYHGQFDSIKEGIQPPEISWRAGKVWAIWIKSMTHRRSINRLTILG